MGSSKKTTSGRNKKSAVVAPHKPSHAFLEALEAVKEQGEKKPKPKSKK